MPSFQILPPPGRQTLKLTDDAEITVEPSPSQSDAVMMCIPEFGALTFTSKQARQLAKMLIKATKAPREAAGHRLLIFKDD